MSVLILDCTELYYRPVRTGIQRVVRELLRHWPANGPKLLPARLDTTRGLVPIPAAAVALLDESEPGASVMPLEQLQARLGAFAHETGGAPLPTGAPLLIPEIFYDPKRCEFHEQRLAAHPNSLAMLAYDFLPYMRPEVFRFTSAMPLMVYLRLISMASHVAFISEKTRFDFTTRVLRVPSNDRRIGPVLPLGADGLQIEQQAWRRDRRHFVCIGSLENRKNQHVVVQAFIQLWELGHDIPFILIGRKFDPQPLAWLERAQTFPHFCWLDTASDHDVAAILRDARATIFLSGAEGFGLPPVESLKAGIPVIALPDVPSLAMLPARGQVRLPAATPESVMEAVLRVADNKVAERLWSEAATLELGTWQMFGAKASEWCQGFVAQRSRRTKPRSSTGGSGDRPVGSPSVPRQTASQGLPLVKGQS